MGIKNSLEISLSLSWVDGLQGPNVKWFFFSGWSGKWWVIGSEKCYQWPRAHKG